MVIVTITNQNETIKLRTVDYIIFNITVNSSRKKAKIVSTSYSVSTQDQINPLGLSLITSQEREVEMSSGI